jgi:hypothetical protein
LSLMPIAEWTLARLRGYGLEWPMRIRNYCAIQVTRAHVFSFAIN